MPACAKCHRDSFPGALFCVECGERIPDVSGSPSPDPYLGMTLKGMYLVQQKIGDGGMGQVYQALHVALDAPVAVKIVKRALAADPGVVGRFQREARAASRLRHPNVIAVTDFGQADDGALFMVMEYVTGQNLARVIATESPLPERRIVHVAAQILSALGEAHAHSILHRDLKPENVMVESRRDAPDTVKVLDFGVAKILARNAPASTLTQAGLVCGTPGYMSPEQLSGDELDVRTDLYAVGVVLYEMLTRRLPFDVHVPMEILHHQLSGPPPAPSKLRPHPVSAELEALVMRALSPDRERRPDSAEAMRAELLACAVEAEPRPDPGAGTPTDVLPRRDSPRGAAVPRRPRASPATSSPPATSPTLRTPAAGTRRKSLESTRAAPAAAPADPADPAQDAPRPSTGAGRAIRSSTRGEGPPTPVPPPASSGWAEAEAPLTPEIVGRIERRAAPLLGPIARVLIKRASGATTTAGQLCQALAAFISTEAERRAFLTACAAELDGARTATVGTPARGSVSATVGPARPAAGTAPPATAVTWDPVVLERLRRALAEHIGPVARLVVTRVAPTTRDAQALCDALAREVPDDSDRAAFLLKARRAIESPA